MAGTPVEFDPFASGAPPAGAPVEFDPFQAGGNILRQATAPITGYIPTEMQMAQESADQMARGGRQMAEGALAAVTRSPSETVPQPGAYGFPSAPGGGAVDIIKGIGNLAAGGLGYVSAPASAFIHSILGQPVANISGSPTAGAAADFAAGLLLPLPKRAPSLRPLPEPPARVGGVTLSQGEATGRLPAIQQEQAAGRGVLGAQAEQAFRDFQAQRTAELAAARETTQRAFDPQEALRAETPQEAGAVAQRGVSEAAALDKARVDALYEEARRRGGYIAPNAFEEMPATMRNELTYSSDPVFVSKESTPFASQQLDYLDQRISQMGARNLAAPGPTLNGLSLEGVSNIRKVLSDLRRDAYARGTSSDQRATSAILNSFDRRIDGAVNSGQFIGDPAAVAAWNDARAAHSDYRATFGGTGTRDPVGQVVQKIIGTEVVPTTPQDVVKHLMGAIDVNPSGLNVAVANRVRDILGPSSPQWSAVKQGLFQRMTVPAEGMRDFGPAVVADRLSNLLNGKGQALAEAMYTPAERSLIQQYAEVMRRIQVPGGGAPWSNTPQFIAQSWRPSFTYRALNAIGSELGSLVTAALGGLGHLGLSAIGGEMGLGAVGSGAAAYGASRALGLTREMRQAAQIRRMMPVLGNVVQDFARASTAQEFSPSARNAVRLSLAARNLISNFQGSGVDVSGILRSVQGQQQ